MKKQSATPQLPKLPKTFEDAIRAIVSVKKEDVEKAIAEDKAKKKKKQK